MLNLKILIAILLYCAALCGVVFSYRSPRILKLCCIIGIIIFLLQIGCYFGVKAIVITILAYYILLCLLTFGLRLLSKKKPVYPAQSDIDNFLYNYAKYLNRISAFSQCESKQHPVEQQNALPALSRLFLCAFVPLWLIGFLAAKTFNSVFSYGNHFLSLTASVKNKITVIFKNRQTA